MGCCIPSDSQAVLTAYTWSCEFKCCWGQRRKLGMCLLNRKELLFSFKKERTIFLSLPFFFTHEGFSRLSFISSLLIAAWEQRNIVLPVSKWLWRCKNTWQLKKKKMAADKEAIFGTTGRMATVMSDEPMLGLKGWRRPFSSFLLPERAKGPMWLALQFLQRSPKSGFLYESSCF